MAFLPWIYHAAVSTERNTLPGGLYLLGILAAGLRDAAKWAPAGDETQGVYSSFPLCFAARD